MGLCVVGIAAGRQHAEFGLVEIEPTAMLWNGLPFEALYRPPDA
jgi:hypothetical protein